MTKSQSTQSKLLAMQPDERLPLLLLIGAGLLLRIWHVGIL